MLILQAIGLFLVFATFILKDIFGFSEGKILPQLKRPLSWGYWGIGALGVGIAGFVTIWTGCEKIREGAKAETLKIADEGRNIFHDGLLSPAPARVEMSFEKLDRAIEGLRYYPDLAWRLAVAMHDRALGDERVSYGNSPKGCLYFRDGGRVDSCWVREGSKIYVSPPTYKALRCTDVEHLDLWKDTRNRYTELERKLKDFESEDVLSKHYADDISAAARSAGYFRFCDYARFQQGSLEQSDHDWKLALRTATSMPTRHDELEDKIKFLSAVSNQSSDLTCARECSMDEDARPIPASMIVEGGEYYDWRFDSSRSLTGVELENASKSTKEGLTLASCSQTECSGQIRATLTRKASIREAIASWDVRTPPGTMIDVAMTPRIDGNWETPLLVAHWDSTGKSRGSVNSTSEHARIATDTLVVSHPDGADAIRLSITMKSNTPGVSPIVRGIGLSVSGRDTPIVQDLEVPMLSQMTLVEGEKKCSPTAVAMLAGYWSPRASTGWSPRVEDVADGVLDPNYGYGNWSFNVAFVNSSSEGSMRAFVTRLHGVDELATLVTSGVPVVASLNWASGELTGAPIDKTDGHLLLVRGIDSKGDIVVNDPRAEGSNTRRTYLRTEFKRAWRHSHNTVYIVVPSSNKEEYMNILARTGVLRDWPTVR